MIRNDVLYESTLAGGSPQLAIDVTLMDNGTLGFFNTLRPQQLSGSLVGETPTGFIWHFKNDQFNEDLEFKAVTFDRFREYFEEATLLNLADAGIHNDSELHKWYYSKFKEGYFQQ